MSGVAAPHRLEAVSRLSARAKPPEIHVRQSVQTLRALIALRSALASLESAETVTSPAVPSERAAKSTMPIRGPFVVERSTEFTNVVMKLLTDAWCCANCTRACSHEERRRAIVCGHTEIGAYGSHACRVVHEQHDVERRLALDGGGCGRCAGLCGKCIKP